MDQHPIDARFMGLATKAKALAQQFVLDRRFDRDLGAVGRPASHHPDLHPAQRFIDHIDRPDRLGGKQSQLGLLDLGRLALIDFIAMQGV